MSKKKPNSRQIISDSPSRRPYGAKVGIILDDTDEFGFDGEASLLVNDQKSIVRIVPSKDDHPFYSKKGKNQGYKKKFDVYVEGFTTAGEAEQKGLKLALALLWSAVSRKHPLRLDYHTPLPCMVYDRNHEYGGGFIGIAQLTVVMSTDRLVELIDEVFSTDIEIDRKLLLSMEMFASARLETTERTRFVGLVSSLEPLAEPHKYPQQDLQELVNSFIDQLQALHSLSNEIKESLTGRIRELKQESISQAIRNLIKESLPGNVEAVNLIKEAYNIRSKILHEGTFDADLDEKSKDLEDIIRQIYAYKLKHELFVRPNQ